MSRKNSVNLVFFTFNNNLELETMNDCFRQILNLDPGSTPSFLTDILNIQENDLKTIKNTRQSNLIVSADIASGLFAGQQMLMNLNRPRGSSLFYVTGIINTTAANQENGQKDYINNLNLSGLYTNIFLDSHIGIAVIAPDRTVYKVNPFIRNLFKIGDTGLEGQNFGDVFLCKNTVESGEKCGTAEACRYCSISNGVNDVLDTGMSVEDSEIQYEFILNGRLDQRWFTITISALYHNGMMYALISFMDITAKKQIESRLIRYGITDGLTGLYNRNFIIKELNKLSSSEKYGHLPCSIAMIDIDDFKHVNDVYGHLAGDNVLKGLADIIAASTRHYDFAGRYGGEEFLLILPDTSLRQAEFVVNRIADKFRAAVFNDIDVSISFSAGIVEAVPNLHDHKDLFHKSDNMMYKAKAAGKNCIRGIILNSK